MVIHTTSPPGSIIPTYPAACRTLTLSCTIKSDRPFFPFPLMVPTIFLSPFSQIQCLRRFSSPQPCQGPYHIMPKFLQQPHNCKCQVASWVIPPGHCLIFSRKPCKAISTATYLPELVLKIYALVPAVLPTPVQNFHFFHCSFVLMKPSLSFTSLKPPNTLSSTINHL